MVIFVCPNFRVMVNPLTNREMIVPCRKCSVCRVGKISFLEKLCDYETAYQYRQGNFSSFVTLTLRDGQISHCGLCRSQYIRFLDNFRIRLKREYNKSYKYVGCAEYGDETFRPHYHYVLFGVNPFEAESILRKIWKHSNFDVGYLQPGGTRYVIDYIMTNSNKLTDDNNQYYLDRGLCPPFFTKSSNLGLAYLESKIIPFYREHGYYLDKGKKVILPSYYCNKYGLDSDLSLVTPDSYDVGIAKAKALQTRFRSKGKPFESFKVSSLARDYYNYLVDKYY